MIAISFQAGCLPDLGENRQFMHKISFGAFLKPVIRNYAVGGPLNDKVSNS
jgi:hypothetical protein